MTMGYIYEGTRVSIYLYSLTLIITKEKKVELN